MAFLSSADSDSTLVVTSMDSERTPRGKNEMGFEKDWFNATVESEVWRGNKLRQKKPQPDSSYYEASVANIDFLGSFVKQCQKKRNKYSKNKTSPSSPTSKSPYRRRPTSADTAATYSAAHKYCIPSLPRGRSKIPKHKKCPMRIAELAVPTKRQCIDTWRNKSDILPEFMVERLKQHVLDQRPIVKIPEAIICFQRRSPSTSKTRCKSAEKKRENYVDLSKPSRYMDSRTLCILFAHKITKRLSKQLNLTLNSDLKRLSKIIHEDIAKLLTKCTFSKKTKYKAIHTDVSNKITIWITSILDDLSLKLLEEDLRDLEEEEGPVLDFIDDLFDNVIDICQPPPMHVESDSEESNKSESAKVDELIELPSDTDIPVTKVEEIFNTAETENMSDEEYVRKEIQNVIDTIRFDPTDYFRNEIANIIDNINKESGDDTSNGSGDVTDNDIDANTLPAEIKSNNNNADLTDKTFDIKGSNKMAVLPLKNEYIDINSDSDVAFNELNIDENVDEDIDGQNEDIDGQNGDIDGQNDDEHIDSQNVDELIVTQNVEDENVDERVDESGQNDSNVSERTQILLEDSDDGTEGKKIKFSHKDLVKPHSDDLTGQYKEGDTKDEFEKYNKVQSNSVSDKSLIIFSEPNTHLLSDADEPWPADLDASLKITESVNKSISSLGNILEIDEILKSPPKSVTTENLVTPITTKEAETFLYKLKDLMNKEDTEIQTFELIEEVKETTAVEPSNIRSNFKSVDKRSDKTVVVSSKYKKHELDYTESEILSTDSSFSGRATRRVNKTSNKIPSYHKSSSLSDCGWRKYRTTTLLFIPIGNFLRDACVPSKR
ncbi:uncharacterized protein LOC111353554 isoform X2 [Spodoptera litura]|uniref:Uncharacterized protein LOC111353554 isoform X2 n=1 Tax=Spodoptera litura TaxID=69820 RepID=A0A9J7E6K3_SPOLT|nr:uncharacterized protein LOC111353554 isoform X2 [Spodoptera litura]